MIDVQFDALKEQRKRDGAPEPTRSSLPGGGVLITIKDVNISGAGWNRPKTDVLFVAPPGYPAAQPDCFWVEPGGFRLANEGVGQSSNDGTPIPSDVVPGRSATWFSWHLQTWNPNRDSLLTFFNVIMNRLKPAR